MIARAIKWQQLTLLQPTTNYNTNIYGCRESNLGDFPKYFRSERQGFCVIPGDGHGMFKMGGAAAIEGDNSPVIRENASLLCSHIDHRLNGDHHAWFQGIIWMPWLNIVQYLRVLVHTTAHAMPTILPYYREARLLNVLLYGPADVTHAVSSTSRRDTTVERVFRHLQQSLNLSRHLTHRYGNSGVRVPTVVERGEVDGDDVALF